MVIRYFGSNLSPARIRDALGTTPFGVSARTILETGVRLGLRGRILRIDASKIEHLPRATILHWEFDHFVVFDEVTRGGVRIVDPAAGRRLIPLSEFAEKFTGLCLTFEVGDDFTAGVRDRSPLVIYVARLLQERSIALRILAASFFVQLFGILLPAVMGVVIDRVLPYNDSDLLAIIAISAPLIVVFSATASLARSYAFAHLRARTELSTTTGFVAHMLSLPYDFFQRRSIGDLMSRVYSNGIAREMLNTTVISALLDGSLVVLYALVVLAISPPLAGVLVFFGAAFVIALLAMRPRMIELMAEELSAKSLTTGRLQQVLSGIHTLKAVGAEMEGLQGWSVQFARELNSTIRRQTGKAQIDAVFHFIDRLAPLAVLGVGAILVMRGGLSLGTMLAISALSSAFLEPLAELARGGVQLFEAQSHLERIHDVLSSAAEPRGPVGQRLQLDGSLQFEEVTYTYDGAKKPALDEVSFTVEPGQSVAIVGSSGCGKSTLVHLILGLYPPTEGAVRFGGRDLQGLPIREVRRSIGYVPQDPYIFEGSVRENIALTRPDASLEEVAEAARMACIHDDVRKMFGGYDTRLAAGGESISGGQQQRIAIARALLNRPRILALDEATSALDAITEARVVENLERLRCTRIIVAHRLSTIVNADLIVVMNQGRIVDMARHDVLMSREGLYRQLVGPQLDEQGERS